MWIEFELICASCGKKDNFIVLFDNVRELKSKIAQLKESCEKCKKTLEIWNISQPQ